MDYRNPLLPEWDEETVVEPDDEAPERDLDWYYEPEVLEAPC